MTGSYSNPLRGLERRLAPSFEQRQFRDPGLAGMSSGLGSLHRGAPIHIGKLQRLQSGGTINPVGEIYASTKPNLYNPDPMRRRILQSVTFNPRNAAFTAAPGSGMPFPYADGGQATDQGADGQDFEDVMQPEDQQTEPDDEERQVVLEAMAALEGEAEDPEEAIAHFIDVFGPRALKDLQRMVESKHQEEEGGEEEEGPEEEQEEQQEPQGGEESDSQDDLSSMLQQMGGSPGQEDQLAGAGGGLLHGPGTGQSDEIEGTTPTGRPVLLSDGEYVFDAPTVAALGDGSTNAGARRLDELRRKIREDSYGSDKQAKPMRKGGITF